MRILRTETDERFGGSGVKTIYECEHCAHQMEGFRNTENKEALIELWNCPACKTNARGEVDTFDLAAFLAAQGPGSQTLES